MKKIHSIQYLRALAALSVVTLHASKRVEAEIPTWAPQFFHLGHGGVDLFFVISGFIIWHIGRTDTQRPGTFFLRRAIRVAPLYWLAIAFWLTLVASIGYSWIDVSYQHVMKSLFFIPHFNPTFPDHIWPVLIPGWTLNYEMFFYSVFAVALLLPGIQKLWLMTAVLGGLVTLGALVPLRSAWALTYTSPLLLEFLAGCFVAELWQRSPGGKLRNGIVILCGLTVFFLLGPFVQETNAWARVIGFGLPATLLLSGVVGLNATLPRWRTLERLGDASYAMYLFHIILLLPLSEIWNRLPEMNGSYNGFIFISAFICLTCPLGIFVHQCLEKPTQCFLVDWLFREPRKQVYAEK